jgi:hypothetical protein
MRRATFLLVPILGLGLVSSQAAWAGLLYGNSAGGTNAITEFDSDTGMVLRELDGGPGNGRGVVVVGDVIYYTDASSNTVKTMDRITGTPTGVAFTVTGATALATMAYDGTNFWIGDYSGSNNAFHYTPTGTLLDTVSLSMCSSFCDGLEFAILGGEARLISNRFDGGFGGINTYDVYDTSGNLVQAALLTQVNGTGIAFDGTNFFVSDIFNNRVGKFDASGTFIEYINYSTGGHLVEDLSADYDIVLPPAPEPGAIALMSAAIGALALYRRRRLSRNQQA